MFSLISRILSPSGSDWSERVRGPLLEIEHFYRSRTDIPYLDRRRIAKERLCRIDGFSPYAAKTVLKQWDKAFDLRPKLKSRRYDSELEFDLEDDSPAEPAQPTPIIQPVSIPRLGESLVQAGLVAQHQIEVALMDAQYREDLRIGEILSLRGWIDQATADFFADKLPSIVTAPQKQPIGQYLMSARLLNQTQIDAVLDAQRRQSVRFGEIAVAQNFIKQQTVDFFLQWLT